MSKLGFPYYIEQLRYITAVTEMLNTANLPDEQHYYIHVELREVDTHRKVGEWSDEIASDAWSFSEVSA